MENSNVKKLKEDKQNMVWTDNTISKQRKATWICRLLQHSSIQ